MNVRPQYETPDETDGDPISEFRHPPQSVAIETAYLSPENRRENSQPYFQMGVPTFSNGLTTFGYQQVLRNRISDSKLQNHAEYDVEKYTPTFVHDCLMLPGTLANLLEKVSQLDIIPRMTPALLPGYRAIPHGETGVPYLIKSKNTTDYVQGVLIFGQGKTARRRIREHYRPHARRMKVFVEIDVKVSVPTYDRGFAGEQWQLQRRRLKAHAWLRRAEECNMHLLACPDAQPWTLEDYLESNDDNASLRIDLSVYDIEEDGGVSLRIHEQDVPDTPEREVVCAGPGTILYDRLEEGWSGW